MKANVMIIVIIKLFEVFSKTIIDIDSISLEYNNSLNLNTKTSRTSIEIAITTPLPNTSFCSTSTPIELNEVTVKFDLAQEHTTTFYSVLSISKQILNLGSETVSSIISPTLFNI
ncbi:22735_t:CDS:2, partial [Gigaspora margarita]